MQNTPADAYFYNGEGRIFSNVEQFAIASEAQSAYFITMVMCQFSHIWMCKTRTRSLFQHGVGNMMMNFGVIIEIALAIIVVYVPFLNPIFQSHYLAGQYWLPWLCGAATLWGYNEGRKWWFRKWPRGRVARWLIW